MNQMIKYYKVGFGFVTEIVSEDLQRGLMDRQTGIDLIKKYDGKCSEDYISSFCLQSHQRFWEHVLEFFRTPFSWQNFLLVVNMSFCGLVHVWNNACDQKRPRAGFCFIFRVFLIKFCFFVECELLRSYSCLK